MIDRHSEETKRMLSSQIHDCWDMGDISYVVGDDCGPCVIAAFSFQYHAELFVRTSAEDHYVCDEQGEPVEEE